MSSAREPKARQGAPRVGLFVTCLVDLYRPSVGFSAVELLERAGCLVEVPERQTCCGQPAYNSGDRKTSQEIAKQVIQAFEGYDYLVLPSGSCGATLRKDYPQILAEDPAWAERAEAFSAKCYELLSFLCDVMSFDLEAAKLPTATRATYHDSCSGLRSLGVKAQPRKLLDQVENLQLLEMKDSETCCGFGGTFCVKYPEISNKIVSEKIGNIAASQADLLLAGDMGCLLNMAGKLKREGSKVQVRHVAEVLAGQLDQPAIGEGSE